MSGNGVVSNYFLVTDGAFSSSRNQMGIGLIFINKELDKKILEYSKMYKGGTNNIAELVAVIVGFKMIKNPINSLTVCTDSEYVIGCAIKGWKRKKNQKLWEAFDKEYSRVSSLCSNITWKHVKGHQNDNSEFTKWNNYVDKLAVRASRV